MTEDDLAIAHYRSELVAEAELARTDLDEIEDHLRSLAGELRDTGMPRAEAIAEACRRLGDPRHIAREHARVRSPFGVKLSRARSWSAAALLVTMMIVGLRHLPTFFSHGRPTPIAVEITLFTTALVALAARISWARPLIVGSLIVTLGRTVAWSMMSSHGLASLPWFVGTAGALAFVIPWRRGEITSAGWTLALLAPAYNAAMSSMMYETTAPHGVILANPFGTLALAGAIAAGVGIVTRARWASFAAAVAAFALVPIAAHVWSLTVRLPDADAARTMILVMLVAGCATATMVSVLAWRTARSTFGTLRGVLG